MIERGTKYWELTGGAADGRGEDSGEEREELGVIQSDVDHMLPGGAGGTRVS